MSNILKRKQNGKIVEVDSNGNEQPVKIKELVSDTLTTAIFKTDQSDEPVEISDPDNAWGTTSGSGYD